VLDGTSVKRGSVSVVTVGGADVLVDAIDVDDWTVVLVTIEAELEQEETKRPMTDTFRRSILISQPPWFVSRLLPKAHTPAQQPRM
jgi:hypothetical protein